jgi:hypothetical protein
MLTNDEILQQYERYNASANLDAETQEILGSILNVLDTWLRSNAARQEKADIPADR